MLFSRAPEDSQDRGAQRAVGILPPELQVLRSEASPWNAAAWKGNDLVHGKEKKKVWPSISPAVLSASVVNSSQVLVSAFPRCHWATCQESDKRAQKDPFTSTPVSHSLTVERLRAKKKDIERRCQSGREDALDTV